jgi:hypothetical protein
MRKEGTVQLNALIKADLHTELKMQSVREGRPMAAILEDALKTYLNGKTDKNKKKA